jgi:hypothetical protein
MVPGEALGETWNLFYCSPIRITTLNTGRPHRFIPELACMCISSCLYLFQELEEVYSDLCSTLSESVLQGAEIISARVSQFSMVCKLFSEIYCCSVWIIGSLCIDQILSGEQQRQFAAIVWSFENMSVCLSLMMDTSVELDSEWKRLITR